MNNIDQKIQAALRRDGAGTDLLEEPNLAEEAITAFRGRNRVISTFAFVLTFVFFGGAVWAGWRFYGAETVPAQIQWGALAFLLILMVSFLKLWFWLEMHTNRVLRELKRVELLLVTRDEDKEGVYRSLRIRRGGTDELSAERLCAAMSPPLPAPRPNSVCERNDCHSRPGQSSTMWLSLPSQS